MGTDLELRQRAAIIRSNARSHHEGLVADLLDRLAGSDGQRLRTWMKEQQDDRMSAPDPAERWLKEWDEGSPVDVDKLDAYHEDDLRHRIVRVACGDHDDPGKTKVVEAGLIDATVALAYFAAATEPLSPREKLSSARRGRKASRIAKKAQELADLLDEPSGPTWPSAIELLSRSPEPIRGQSPTSFLVQLAKCADREGRRPVRDVRPATGSPDARVLAREVSYWFNYRYGRVPYAIVADIVNLLSQPDPPADDAAVKAWWKTRKAGKPGKPK